MLDQSKNIALIVFKTLGVLALLVAAIGGYLYYKSDSFNEGRLEIQVDYSPSECSGDYPLRIVIANSGNRQLDLVGFYVRGRRDGYSSIVTTEDIRSDRIIPAGEQYVGCWRHTVLDRFDAPDYAALVWDVSHISYSSFE